MPSVMPVHHPEVLQNHEQLDRLHPRLLSAIALGPGDHAIEGKFIGEILDGMGQDFNRATGFRRELSGPMDCDVRVLPYPTIASGGKGSE